MTGHAGLTHLHALTQVSATADVGDVNPTDMRGGSTLSIRVHATEAPHTSPTASSHLEDAVIANKQLPKPGDYKEQQGFLSTMTFRGSATMSTDNQQVLHLWLKHQSALGQLQRDAPHGSRLPVRLNMDLS